LKVISIDPATSVSALAGTAGYPLLFITEPTLPDFAAIPADALPQLTPTVHSVAIVGPNDSDGQGTAPLILSSLEAKGFVAKEFLYPEGTTDLSSIMSKVEAWHPNMIILGWAVSDWTPTVLALTPAGIPSTTPIFGWSSSISAASLPGMDGRPFIADPAIQADFTSPAASAAAKEFETDLQAVAGGTLPPNPTDAEFYYAGVFLLAKAADQAGTVTDTAKIAATMKTVSAQALGSTVSYDSSDHIVAPQSVTLVDHGSYRTLEIGA
jgi:ABC-type branched-subunit amino acid transport system substrate-binding protein